MHSGKNGNRFAGHINPCEDHSGLRDTREPLGQLFWGQVVQLQGDMILLGSAPAAFTDLNGHGAGHHVTGGQILGNGSIPERV